jgi:hypothetical protein
MPICDQCGKDDPDAELMDDPYAKEINEVIVEMTLCPACHQDRLDDI